MRGGRAAPPPPPQIVVVVRHVAPSHLAEGGRNVTRQKKTRFPGVSRRVMLKAVNDEATDGALLTACIRSYTSEQAKASCGIFQNRQRANLGQPRQCEN